MSPSPGGEGGASGRGSGARRAFAWARRRHRVVLGQLLRGVSYGLGTTVVSLAALWVQHRP